MDKIWTVYGSMLSFDTPKEETMQDVAQFVQLAQILCYDLARAEKATDGKKHVQSFFLDGQSTAGCCLKHPFTAHKCKPLSHRWFWTWELHFLRLYEKHSRWPCGVEPVQPMLTRSSGILMFCEPTDLPLDFPLPLPLGKLWFRSYGDLSTFGFLKGGSSSLLLTATVQAAGVIWLRCCSYIPQKPNRFGLLSVPHASFLPGARRAFCQQPQSVGMSCGCNLQGQFPICMQELFQATCHDDGKPGCLLAPWKDLYAWGSIAAGSLRTCRTAPLCSMQTVSALQSSGLPAVGRVWSLNHVPLKCTYPRHPLQPIIFIETHKPVNKAVSWFIRSSDSDALEAGLLFLQSGCPISRGKFPLNIFTGLFRLHFSGQNLGKEIFQRLVVGGTWWIAATKSKLGHTVIDLWSMWQRHHSGRWLLPAVQRLLCYSKTHGSSTLDEIPKHWLWNALHHHCTACMFLCGLSWHYDIVCHWCTSSWPARQNLGWKKNKDFFLAWTRRCISPPSLSAQLTAHCSFIGDWRTLR